MAGDRDSKVRQRAYEIWEKEDRPSGRDRDHWHRAERELETADSGPTTEAAIGGVAAPSPVRRRAPKATAPNEATAEVRTRSRRKGAE